MRRLIVSLLTVSYLAIGGTVSAAAPPRSKQPVAMSEAAAKAAANFEIQKLADGVYAAIRKDPPGLMCDGNSVFIVNDDDVIVVDAPEASREMLSALRKITNKPVSYVINTHWHDDHVTGNQVYRDAFPRAEFIAHAATRAYLPAQGATNRKQMIEGAPGAAKMLRDLAAKNKSLTGGELTAEERASYQSDVDLVDHYMAVVPGAEIVLPTITVDDRMTIHRGERTIEIVHLGRGHTSGDIAVFLPKEKIVVAGDLVIWPVPLVGSDQSHPADWSASLGKLRALNATTIVPGHGKVMHDDEYVEQMQALFDSVRQQVSSAIGEGKSLEETRKTVDLSSFRRTFAGDSPVRKVMFDMYVTGPAVAAAFADASPAH